MLNLSAFKAYDIRGTYPKLVNEELAYSVGRAVAKYFSAKQIVIGYDMRKSSPSLAKNLIDGIIAEGVNVIDIGMCTTPMLSFAVAKYRYDGGVMISASHNPGSDNAFKIIDKNAIQLDESHGLNNIKALIIAGYKESSIKIGQISNKTIIFDYLQHIKQILGSVQPLKVVFDYSNGVGSIPCSPLVKDLGLDVIELFTEPDGNFPNHPANPHDLVNFADLITEVKSNGADLGVFYDGDADRANFVDDIGRVVPVDLLVVLLAQQELKSKSGNVYYDLRFSKAVPTFIEKAGGTPIMMRVGNPFYKQVLYEKGGVLGAEFAGHIMFPDNYNIDDGLFAALKVIKLIGDSGKKLSQLIDEVTVFSASPEESMEAKNPSTVFSRLITAFPEAKQIKMDGVYLDFGENGFISVRRSQNELQLFRIRVEAKTSEQMKTRFDKTKKIVAEG